MFYLDTSLVIPLLTNESATADAQDWARRSAPLAVSAWVTVELRSALAFKTRVGDLADSSRERALQAYFEAARDEFAMLAITNEVFREAARLAGTVKVGLRGADALHLAIAAAHAATLATRDRRQSEAGAALGVKTLLL